MRPVHLKKPVIVVDVLKYAAEKAGARFIHDTIENVEIELIEITKAQGTGLIVPAPMKYPLIAVFHDFPEMVGEIVEATLPRIIIATVTDPKIRAEARYAQTFRPILYPIYQRFIYELGIHTQTNVNSGEQLLHRKFDRMYWGTKPAGQSLNDYVDAIEIQDMKLPLIQFC